MGDPRRTQNDTGSATHDAGQAGFAERCLSSEVAVQAAQITSRSITKPGNSPPSGFADAAACPGWAAPPPDQGRVAGRRPVRPRSRSASVPAAPRWRPGCGRRQRGGGRWSCRSASGAGRSARSPARGGLPESGCGQRASGSSSAAGLAAHTAATWPGVRLSERGGGGRHGAADPALVWDFTRAPAGLLQAEGPGDHEGMALLGAGG